MKNCTWRCCTLDCWDSAWDSFCPLDWDCLLCLGPLSTVPDWPVPPALLQGRPIGAITLFLGSGSLWILGGLQGLEAQAPRPVAVYWPPPCCTPCSLYHQEARKLAPQTIVTNVVLQLRPLCSCSTKYPEKYCQVNYI